MSAAPTPRILIVDDDAWILRMVSTVLEKRGYAVDTASDGEEALEHALARTPDLIITDVMMPHMDGWTLIRTLRAQPATAFTPVIFLTALGNEEDRIRGFRLGADDYLATPFRFEELDLRVQNALRRVVGLKQEAREATGPTAGMRGSLAQIGLSALLVMLDLEKKTGHLTLMRKGEVTRIQLREGRLIDANLVGQQTGSGVTSIYNALAWSEGEFAFVAGEVSGDDRIGQTTTEILIEGARRLDEANRK
jgi:DNA-binding response OmpR family regulator